jgi:uncharacterized protein
VKSNRFFNQPAPSRASGHLASHIQSKAMKGMHYVRAGVFGLLLIAFVGFSTPAIRAQRVDELPRPTDYVNDYAHVLSPQAIARLDSICSQLDHNGANVQLAIVTVHNLAGEDAADYANKLEDRWKMGKKGSDRGVLVLLARDDHKYRIDVGYGLEGILNDARIGDIGREMVPYLRARDYDGAVTLAVGNLAQVIAVDANVTLQDLPAPATPSRTRPKPFLLIFVLILFGFAFTVRMLMCAFSPLGFWTALALSGSRGAGGGGGGSSSDSRGAGSSGGGSDSGFGGFDGGSFGGGGAGGDW